MPRNYIKKKYRKSAYLIEGWHLFDEAVQAGVTIEKIFAPRKLPRSASRFSSNYLGFRGDFAGFGRYANSSRDCIDSKRK